MRTGPTGWVIAAGLALGAAQASCALDPSTKDGCRSANDCLGDRECVDGVCQDPGPGDTTEGDQGCASLCDFAVGCGWIDDARSCTATCVDGGYGRSIVDPTCTDPVLADCFDDFRFPSCLDWECIMDTDCLPSHACEANVCRQRCRSDSECASKYCFVERCSDPSGGACDPSQYSCGHGGRCVNVDAHNLTVEPYCSIFCFEGVCVGNFVCVDYECLKP